MNLRSIDEIHPLPITFKDILSEKLQAVPVNLNNTPGMAINQFGKIALLLLYGLLISTATK
jgi:hypothetical protein